MSQIGTRRKSKYDDVIQQMVDSGLFRLGDEGQIETCYQWRACREFTVPWYRCDRKDGSGYYYVSFRHNRVKSHRLAYALHTGEHLAGREINHLDGNPINNRPSNLEACDASRNSKHAFDTGLNPARGERHSRSKLTDEIVVEARRKARLGIPYTRIARDIGVTAQCIRYACTGFTWAHVTSEPPITENVKWQ